MERNPNNLFGERLKTLRTEKGITQTMLSRNMGKKDSTARMWEIGKNMPDAETLVKLAEFFECSVDYLLGVNMFRNYTDFDNFVEQVNIFEDKIAVMPADFKEIAIDCLETAADSFLYADEEERNAFLDVYEIVNNAMASMFCKPSLAQNVVESKNEEILHFAYLLKNNFITEQREILNSLTNYFTFIETKLNHVLPAEANIDVLKEVKKSMDLFDINDSLNLANKNKINKK